MRLNLLTCILILCFSSKMQAFDGNICENGIDGLPLVELHGISCQIRQKLDQWDGEDLKTLTDGFISELRIQADIDWPSQSLTYQSPLQRDGSLIIQIPPQNLRLELDMIAPASFYIDLRISPIIQISGGKVCAIKLERFEPGILSLESPLENWLNQSLLEALNRDPAILRPIQETLDEQISLLQAENCQAAPSPEPAQAESPAARNQLHADMQRLREKHQVYLQLSKQNLDSQGWLLDTHCDGLLFNSLYAIAGGGSDISLAEDRYQPGRYYRHWQQNCYANFQKGLAENASKSSISRDMLKGLALWMIAENQQDRLYDLLDFAEHHSLLAFPFISLMGEGQMGRADLTPAFLQSFYQMRQQFSQTPIPEPLRSWDFQIWGPCSGYPCHLMALHILLKWRIHGDIDRLAEDRLRWLVHREPHNALYAGIYALVSGTERGFPQALRTLLNNGWFPAGRLPSSHERCSAYIFERDYLRDGVVSQDWRPCPERNRTFSGVDFLLASSILLEAYDRLYGDFFGSFAGRN